MASYNILSQELLEDNDYLYRHCHPAVLPWSHRLPNLLAEIRRLNADVSRSGFGAGGGWGSAGLQWLETRETGWEEGFDLKMNRRLASKSRKSLFFIESLIKML